MAEDEGGGGKGLSGTINLPGIGPAKKKVVFAIAGAGGAWVLWRYWQSSQAAATAADQTDANGDGFPDAGVLPPVAGAVKPDNNYGSSDGSSAGTTDSFGFTGTTNSQWTQYAAAQLSASDVWSYTQILTALGQYLANKPLDSTAQQIVQAAIGVAGQPPEGTHVVVPGGDVPITVAPGHLRAWDTTTATQIGFQWDPVAGASHYRIYRAGLGDEPVGDSQDTKFWARGLQGNKSYTFQVAAVSAGGKVGPKSAPYTAKTKAVSLAKPGGVRVSSVTKSTAKISWNPVTGADEYKIYINNVAHGSSDHSPYTVQGLKPNTSYKVTVRADTSTQGPGPESSPITFRTKK